LKPWKGYACKSDKASFALCEASLGGRTIQTRQSDRAKEARHERIIFMTIQIENPNSETLFNQCQDLAESPSILSRLDQNLKKYGFAGSTNIPRTVFLATCTRMFPQPVSVVIKGPSSSGKSFALKAALRYVPDEACEIFHGLSEKALVYASNLNLQHRHLVIQEAAGLAEGNGRTFLRQLLSEGEVRYMTVQNTKDGNVGQELPVIKGPIGLLMTTTANSLHWEDETRMLSMQVDQSPEQIMRALLANVRNGPTSPPEGDLSRWHALHRYVTSRPLSVVIPYEEALLSCLPTSHQRVLRDAPQVLSLIRAHALLHQCTRDREGGSIVANLDDYSVVNQLIADTLSQGLDKSVAPHIREVVEAVSKVHAVVGAVSLTELATTLGRDAGAVCKNVKAAVAQGYLDDQNPGQGRRSMLVPGKQKLPTGTVLPSPEKLIERWEGKQTREPRTSTGVSSIFSELPY
jgi:hypothetical protein